MKTLPEKCRKCGMLSAQQAQMLHGIEGDRCWKPSVCYSRRSYARNRDRINQTRSRKRKEGQLESIAVEFEPLTSIVFAVLVVYRMAGSDTPVHANDFVALALRCRDLAGAGEGGNCACCALCRVSA